jgi:hypothetical protein
MSRDWDEFMRFMPTLRFDKAAFAVIAFAVIAPADRYQIDVPIVDELPPPYITATF